MLVIAPSPHSASKTRVNALIAGEGNAILPRTKMGEGLARGEKPLTLSKSWADHCALSRKGSEPYCVQKNFHHTINQLSEARSTAQMADCIQVTVAGAHQAALSCRSCHMSAPAVLCKLHLSSQIAAPSNSQNEALRKEARTVHRRPPCHLAEPIRSRYFRFAEPLRAMSEAAN